MIDTEKDPAARSRCCRNPSRGLKIGPPLDFSRYAGMEGDRFVLRSVTDEIMYELMTLPAAVHHMYATPPRPRSPPSPPPRVVSVTDAEQPVHAA